MRAKVTVKRIETHEYASGYVMRKAYFTTVLDSKTAVDKRFQVGGQQTGEIMMVIDNPIAIQMFKAGRNFYIEFSEEDEQNEIHSDRAEM